MQRFQCGKKALLAGVVILSSTQALAETEAKLNEPFALQSIMRDIGTNMQSIVGAISREDWAQVEDSARLIADHPKPPLSERGKIAGFFKADMAQFKNYDGQTHKAASLLAEAADSKDGKTVISNFATLQNTCLACHQKFREDFQQHFYGKH